jgi:exosome complex RNA-binding protein Rrp4
MTGTMRGSVSANVTPGESVLALDKGILPRGIYFVKVKLNGEIMQNGIYKFE